MDVREGLGGGEIKAVRGDGVAQDGKKGTFLFKAGRARTAQVWKVNGSGEDQVPGLGISQRSLEAIKHTSQWGERETRGEDVRCSRLASGRDHEP